MRRRTLASSLALVALGTVPIAVGMFRPHLTVPDHHFQHFFFLVAGSLYGIAAARTFVPVEGEDPRRRDAWLIPAILAPVAIMFAMWPTTYPFIVARPLLHFAEHFLLVVMAALTTFSAYRFARPIGWLLGGALAAMSLLAVYGYGVTPGPSTIIAQLAAAQAPVGAADGGVVYDQNCVGCHQAEGAGLAGVFPPLAGHYGRLLEAAGGDAYVIRVLLYGLQGPITIEGQTYSGVMPAWSHLSDDQIAAVLNHVAGSWGNVAEAGEPFNTADIADARGEELTPQQVHEIRQGLDLR